MLFAEQEPGNTSIFFAAIAKVAHGEGESLRSCKLAVKIKARMKALGAIAQADVHTL